MDLGTKLGVGQGRASTVVLLGPGGVLLVAVSPQMKLANRCKPRGRIDCQLSARLTGRHLLAWLVFFLCLYLSFQSAPFSVTTCGRMVGERFCTGFIFRLLPRLFWLFLPHFSCFKPFGLSLPGRTCSEESLLSYATMTSRHPFRSPREINRTKKLSFHCKRW